MVNGWREIKKSQASSWHPVKTQCMFCARHLCLFQGKPQERGSGLSPPGSGEKGLRAQFAFYLVCTVLCPRILEALKSGAVCFHSDPELCWSPGAPCNFQTTILKGALANISFSISCLLAGNREGMSSWHCTLEHLQTCNYGILKKSVMFSDYAIKGSQWILQLL